MSSHTVALEGVLQLSLHDRRDDDTAEVLEAELSNLGKLDVDLSTDSAVESERTGSYLREGTLVLVPVGVAVVLLGEVNLPCLLHLVEHECHEVECGVVDGLVRHCHRERDAAALHLDVGKVESLVVDGCNLAYLLHLNVVDAVGVELVANYATDE